MELIFWPAGLARWMGRWVLPLLMAGAAPLALRGAAGPTNDLCAGATIIPGAGLPGALPFPVSTPVTDISSATNASGVEATLVPSCQSSVSRGIWFKFRPVSNAVYNVTTLAAATTVDDTVLAIYTSASGCAGPFLSVACNDDTTLDLLKSSVTAQLVADTDYYIVVWQWEIDPPIAGHTSVQVRIDKQTPPPNDTCLTAVPVALNTRVLGSTVLASNNYRLSGTNAFGGYGQRRNEVGMGRDVVYTFVVPETADYSFKVAGYGGYQDRTNDLMIYIAGYCAPGAGVQIVSNAIAAANRNAASSAEEIMCVPLTNGQVIYIYVDDTNVNIGSGFALEVTRCTREVEPNNTAANASRFTTGLEGSMWQGSDVDYHLIGSFPAGSRLFALLDGEAGNIPDFNMRATTLTDTLEYDDQDNDSAFAQSSPNLAGTPLPDGPIFLRVNYQFGGQAEPYRLYAVVQPPTNAAALEVEPNSTLAAANTSPANYFLGSLAGPSPSQDEDLYRFTASDGDLVFVGVDGDPTRDGSALNTQLELLDEFGNSLLTVNDANGLSNTGRISGSLTADQPNSPAEGIVYRCAEGTYYVRVRIGTTNTGPSGAGDYLLSISKNGIPGETGFNTPPVFSEVTVPTPIGAGPASLTGSFFDPDLGDTATLIINWGDGTSPSVLNFSSPGLNPFNLTHQYPDDATAGVPSQSFLIEIAVTDQAGESASTSRTIVLTNVAPSNIIITQDSAFVAEGTVLSLGGSFTDPGALDTHVVTINWGDNSPLTLLNLPGGAREFSALHQYLDDYPSGTPADDRTITVTVTDDLLGAGEATTTVTVSNVAPGLLDLVVTSPVFVGSNAMLSGVIAESNPLDSFTLEIHWGDGTPAQTFNYPAGATAFNASHAYATGGTNFTIDLVLVDDDLGTNTASTTIQVKVDAQPARFTGLTPLGNNRTQLQLLGTPHATYQILASSDLAAWLPLGTATADGTGVLSFEDTASPPASRFYRAVAQP